MISLRYQLRGAAAMPREYLPSVGAAHANAMLSSPGVFEKRGGPRRIIQGIATSKRMNKNGRVFDPEGAICYLPIPLLWAHDWEEPVGRVTAVKATPQGLFFEARIIDGGLRWAHEFWAHLKSGAYSRVSVSGWGND